MPVLTMTSFPQLDGQGCQQGCGEREQGYWASSPGESKYSVQSHVLGGTMPKHDDAMLLCIL